jgi:hypothetical protein
MIIPLSARLPNSNYLARFHQAPGLPHSIAPASPGLLDYAVDNGKIGSDT